MVVKRTLWTAAQVDVEMIWIQLISQQTAERHMQREVKSAHFLFPELFSHHLPEEESFSLWTFSRWIKRSISVIFDRLKKGFCFGIICLFLSDPQRAVAAWRLAEEATPERSESAKPRRKAGRTRTATRKPDLPSKVGFTDTEQFSLHRDTMSLYAH